MNINKILISIIDKYNLNFNKQKSCLVKVSEMQLMESLNVIPNGSNVGIWGTGMLTDQLISYYKDVMDRYNVTCVIDEDAEKYNGKFMNYPIITPEIAFGTVDYIIIASYSSSYIVSKKIRQNSSIPYINLNKDKINPFFMLFDKAPKKKSNFFSIFGLINALKQEYKKENILELKAKMLKEIIELYILARDFENMFKYGETYIHNKFDDYENIKLFLNEINELLIKVKRTIKDNQYKDKSKVALFTFDTLSADVAKDCKFISKLKKENISFENAFSSSTSTQAYCQNLLNSEYLFGNTEYSDFTFNQNELLKACKERNASFLVNPVFEFDIDKIDENRDKSAIKMPWDYGEWKRTIGETLWSFLCFYIENLDKNFIAYLHFMEMHYPFFGGDHNNDLVIPLEGIDLDRNKKRTNEENVEINNHVQSVEIQMKEARKYGDNIFKYYCDFLPDSCKMIITGDHGYTYSSDKLFNSGVNVTDFSTHIPMIISMGDGQAKELTGMYSHIDIMNLVLSVFDNEDIEQYAKREYVILERGKIRSYRFRELYEGDNPNYLNNIVAIRGKNDMFLYFIKDKAEYYYLINDEKKNLINEPEYKDRINYLKSELMLHLDQTDLEKLNV